MLDNYARRIKREIDKIDPWNYDNGLTWYHEAHDEAVTLGADFSIGTERAAAIIAVLSPGTSWERNLKDARLVCEQGEYATVTTYPANKAKALKILSSSVWFEQVRGNKVRSFFDNIIAPDTSQAVTLDRHMLRFICKTWDDKCLNRIFSSKRNYQAIAERIRRRAKKIGIRPCQLQAALWLEVKP
jgi:hypothetical protein